MLKVAWKLEAFGPPLRPHPSETQSPRALRVTTSPTRMDPARRRLVAIHPANSTQSTTTESDNSIANSQASSAVLSITSPCYSSTAPCNQVYDSSGNEPVEFEIYQDDMYGTFMLAPVHYY